MTNPFLRRGTVALVGAALLVAAPFAASSAFAGVADPLPSRTHFYVPKAPDGAKQQIDGCSSGRDRAAALVKAETTTPQAVWFTGGTPKQVRKAVRKVAPAPPARRPSPRWSSTTSPAATARSTPPAAPAATPPTASGSTASPPGCGRTSG